MWHYAQCKEALKVYALIFRELTSFVALLHSSFWKETGISIGHLRILVEIVMVSMKHWSMKQALKVYALIFRELTSCSNAHPECQLRSKCYLWDVTLCPIQASAQGLRPHRQGVDLFFFCYCTPIWQAWSHEGTDILVSPLIQRTKPIHGPYYLLQVQLLSCSDLSKFSCTYQVDFQDWVYLIIDNRFYRFKSIFGYRLIALY